MCVSDMTSHADQIDDLNTLNQIGETLNRAVDVRGALDSALARLVELMGLETGWIFVKAPTDRDVGESSHPSALPGRHAHGEAGEGYVLAAHHNLPPGLASHDAGVWAPGCKCQRLCDHGRLTGPYNEVRCSRLDSTRGDRRGLAVHASVPLRSGERTVGILNVAAPDWSSFSPRALALLANVGNQMGVALERARLFDLLKARRVHEQAALLDLSNQLLGRSDLDDLMGYLVEEVRRLLRVDASALLLPGERPDRLIFGAASGWRVDPVASQCEVSGDADGGSVQVMREREILLVEDIEASDSDTCGADWLRSEGFRGHALVPLVVDSRSIGVLMIDMRQPRLWDQDEVRFLRLMANQAAIAIEQARLHREEIERQRLEQELAVGRQIQFSMLPEGRPAVPGWAFDAFYQPARQVGGDFYDFFELPGEPGRLGIVIADVADKGVPAALMMALSRAVIRAAALEDRGPAATLRQANRLILKDSRDSLFVTAFYAVLDTGSGRLTYANAGHNRPLWLRAGTGELQELAARGIALGAIEEAELEERAIDVAPGDVLVLYTDGVTEAMDAEAEPFGVERLRQVVAAHPEASPEQIISALEGAVRDFAGDVPQSDDIALFVVWRRSGLEA
jgi:serine phosphatase RsbU (regulator of sigma subunit)